MRKNPIDPGQSDQPDPVSWRRPGAQGWRARLTPARAMVGVLILAVLLCSAGSVMMVSTRSYADTTSTCAATSTPASGSTSTTGGGVTPTPTPRRQKTPTPTPTKGTTPTAVPTTPTVVLPSPSPTDTSTATPDAGGGTVSTGTGGGAVLFSAGEPQMGAMLAGDLTTFSADATCTPTVTPTVDETQTPEASSTATADVPATGSTPSTSTPAGSQGGSSNAGGSRVVLIVGGVFLVLLLGLGIGWFFFRRMLLPQSASSPNLPPSGARPWSRTRVPNPDSMGGMNGGQLAFNGAPGTGNLGAGGPGPVMPGGPVMNPMNSGGPGPAGFGVPGNNGAGFGAPGGNGAGFGVPGGNGAGFGGFSDGFIPPSPQIFPQGENSMIPPGSGAFPVIANANGFAPASQAFNAMYGLPDDPFAGSQGGTPGWMSNLEHGGSSGGPSNPGGGSFAPAPVDLNDPYLNEVIRQYSQKSKSVQPGQPMSPTPPTQQMSPSGPPQPMSAPPPLVPPPPMPPSGPPRSPVPRRPTQQMPPNPSASIPQREPRTGFQDSNWLQ